MGLGHPQIHHFLNMFCCPNYPPWITGGVAPSHRGCWEPGASGASPIPWRPRSGTVDIEDRWFKDGIGNIWKTWGKLTNIWGAWSIERWFSITRINVWFWVSTCQEFLDGCLRLKGFARSIDVHFIMVWTSASPNQFVRFLLWAVHYQHISILWQFEVLIHRLQKQLLDGFAVPFQLRDRGWEVKTINISIKIIEGEAGWRVGGFTLHLMVHMGFLQIVRLEPISIYLGLRIITNETLRALKVVFYLIYSNLQKAWHSSLHCSIPIRRKFPIPESFRTNNCIFTATSHKGCSGRGVPQNVL